MSDALTCLKALRITGDISWVSWDEGIGINEIPKAIENLIHLRYLHLCNLLIKELPETCCELYNLRTLKICFCLTLRKLRERIQKLVSLRHLILRDQTVDYMPKGIERLTGLLSLDQFIGSSDGHYGGRACNLEGLKHLNHLRGSLIIQGLENVTNVEEARKAEIEKKKNLHALELWFDKDEELTLEPEIEVDNEVIIESLRPTPNLEKLEIFDYRGNVLPNWLMSLNILKILKLSRCCNCESMPSLGKLPFLEAIFVYEMDSVKMVGYEFLGIKSAPAISSSSSSLVIAFPKLKFLKFLWMVGWEEWDFGITSSDQKDILIMPHLNHLQIIYCPRLKALPDHRLQSTTLKTLEISNCPIIEERFRKETGENWYKISHIPNISLGDRYVQGSLQYDKDDSDSD